MITHGHLLRVAPEREAAALACAEAAAEVAPLTLRRDSGRPAPWLRTAVFARDGHACVWCGARDDLKVDHYHPHAAGGQTVLGNLQTLCGPCNFPFKWFRPVELVRIDGALYVRTLPCLPKLPRYSTDPPSTQNAGR